MDRSPTETTEDDMDSREIEDVCEDYYRWGLDFLGRVYEVLVQDFRGRTALPSRKRSVTSNNGTSSLTSELVRTVF